MNRQRRKQSVNQGSLLRKRLSKWWGSNSPIWWFGVKFLAVTILLFTVTLLPSLAQAIAAVVNDNARFASTILNALGEHSHVVDGTIYSPQYAITVLPACVGLEFTCFCWAIMLTLPAGWGKRLLGMMIALLALTVLNLLRIVSLYFAGVHFGSSFFNSLHERIWGVIMIPATLYLCFAWAKWARSAKNEPLELHPAP